MGNITQPAGMTLNNVDKNGISIAEIALRYKSDKVIHIQVHFGSALFPKKWNKAIIEQRRTDLDKSLTIRRFGLQDSVPSITDELTTFDIEPVISHNKFYEKEGGDFFIIKCPQYIVLDNDEYASENVGNKMDMYRFAGHEQYRAEYIAEYSKCFVMISQQEGYKGVGIIDMPKNNLILGINVYQQTMDILTAFMSSRNEVNLNSLIFVSEFANQAQLMALALQNFLQENQHTISQPSVNCETLPQRKSIEQNEEVNLNEQLITLTIAEQVQRKYIQNTNNRLFLHEYFTTYKYFRDFQKPFTQETIQSMPINEPTNNSVCLCGRKTTIRGQYQFCCFCRTNRKCYQVCEERACNRSYCSSCKIPQKSRFQCHKGHPFKYIEVSQNQFICDQCLRNSEVLNLGKWRCQQCDYDICGYCYFSEHSKIVYQKILMYFQIIQQLKPNLRSQIKQELVSDYLAQLDYDQLKL